MAEWRSTISLGCSQAVRQRVLISPCAGSNPATPATNMVMSVSDVMLFSGNSSRVLAEKISQCLAIPMGRAVVGKYSDGETMVEILENVRGKDVYLVQSLNAPANDNLMELIVMVDALKRASAGKVTAVIPYFGYGRQDRRVRSARVPITARVVADMFEAVGIDRVVTVDLHADQIQGFFSIPVDNVYTSKEFAHDIMLQNYDKFTVVSPDVGGVVRARAVTQRLPSGSDLVIIDKRRPRPNEAKVMHIIGEVDGYDCLMVDDIVDTAGTLCSAAEALKKKGARKVVAYCTHPVLSGNALSNLESSVIDQLVVTDTIELRPELKKCSKIRQLSIADVLARVIQRVHLEESVSSIFSE